MTWLSWLTLDEGCKTKLNALSHKKGISVFFLTMTQHITEFVFGFILAQTPWPSLANRIFYDLTYREAVLKSEKCRRCAPGRPCMFEAMPKLPYENNYKLEYAEFLTDDELNAKYTGQKDFCDCTPELWGQTHFKETASERMRRGQ
ncbi:hypothetical protein GE061_014123 [Apolygus lucorum]|uniref:Uncharacterized protein n=1 Tax=Apolygus lucorum TaxID=248454 RepID=A0A8S9XPP4_APOLU|nr:hypothetical protein GE061_014123 [Apolygus lucorum]